MINATEQVNCNTTNIFLESEASLPDRVAPFKTFTGLNDER